MRLPYLFCVSMLLCCAWLTSGRTLTHAQKQPARLQFIDITEASVIKCNLKTLAPGMQYLSETMGGGGGFIDYNGDGRLDIYLVCYSQTAQPEGASKLRDALYRNNGD